MAIIHDIDTLLTGLCASLPVSFACMEIPNDAAPIELINLAEEQLRGNERLTFDAIRSQKRRAEFVAGRIAARNALSRLSIGADPGPEIAKTRSGAPVVVNFPKVAVSISHTHSCAVAVATCRGEGIGVDIEQNTPRPNALIDYFYSDNEKRLLNGLAATEKRWAVNRLWTRKEAAVKVGGWGGTLPFKGLDCSGSQMRIKGIPIHFRSAGTDAIAATVAFTEEPVNG